MTFEPQKFFIGLMGFFSILLPGALLTYLLKDEAGPRVLGNTYYRLAGPEGWIVFLFSAHLLGHFIFLLGAALLDDYAYDPIRSATRVGALDRRGGWKALRTVRDRVRRTHSWKRRFYSRCR